MSGGPGYDGRGFPVSQEGVNAQTPRDILEEAEHIPEATHEELGHTLGRLFVWILDGQTLVKMGERFLIVVYKVRPDLTGGVTLAQIASAGARHDRRNWRSYVNKLQRQFTRTFAFRGINDHARHPKDWGPLGDGKAARSHGVVDSHLKLVNRFSEWRAFHDEGQGSVPHSPRARQVLRKDFEPIARYLAELEADA